MQGYLTKLSESENPTHPNNIETGRVFEGEYYSEPKVGECFIIGNTRTSTVQAIIDGDTFRTHNSIYVLTRTAP